MAAQAATNRTIDDQLGDSKTGDLPVYFPPQSVEFWRQGNGCPHCFARPDPGQIYDMTWHDATLHAEYEEINVTMKFTGTAVYAYCILNNNITYDTFTNLTFSIDGEQVGTYMHSPDGTNSFVYDQLVYANSSVPNSDHVFGIHMPTGVKTTLILFDYVMYTYDQESLPAPSTTGLTVPSTTGHSSSNEVTVSKSVIGGVVAAVLGLVLILGVIVALYLRRRGMARVVQPGNFTTQADLPLAMGPPAFYPSSGMYTTGPISNQGMTGTQPILHPIFNPNQPSTGDPSFNDRQLLLRLEACEQNLGLLLGSSTAHPPASSNQVDELKREVEMLREMLRDMNPAPPRYDF